MTTVMIGNWASNFDGSADPITVGALRQFVEQCEEVGIPDDTWVKEGAPIQRDRGFLVYFSASKVSLVSATAPRPRSALAP